MGSAPLGYAHKITKDGKKYITPKEPAASNSKWTFNSSANGQYLAEQIYMEVNKNQASPVGKSGFRNIYATQFTVVKFLT